MLDFLVVQGLGQSDSFRRVLQNARGRGERGENMKTHQFIEIVRIGNSQGTFMNISRIYS